MTPPPSCAPDAEDWLTLSFLPGLGCVLLNRLVQAAGSPGAVLRPGGIPEVAGIGPRLMAILSDRDRIDHARQRAVSELERLEQLGGFLLTLSDPDYPYLLRHIPDPPVTLFGRGDRSLLARPGVAVVGSRAASDYGRRCAFRLAADLAAEGVVVVSGAAYGIDAEAHRGALDAGGATVAVLGCGVDVVYPRSHEALFRTLAERGLLLSEYPLGTSPEPFRFPARNRIISGLCAGVVVVEASLRSGSLITARLALDQGREICAVPGRVDSPKSGGTHRLIQLGAHLVQSAAEVLEALSWEGRLPTSAPETTAPPAETLPEQERQLLECLDIYPADIDALSRASGLAPAELHPLLLQLELRGLVRQLPGQLYERCLPT